MLTSLALALAVMTAPPETGQAIALPFQIEPPDRLFQPKAMPADERRLAKEGRVVPIQFQGGLDMRQRGGWTPKLLPDHLRVLKELSRFTHVEVYASPPVG